MSAELTKPGNPIEEFQNKVIEKLKTDIGSLMPESVLKTLVERAVEEQFFKSRIDSSGYGRSEKPSWFVEKIIEEGKPVIAEYVKNYLKNNEHLLKKGLENFLSEKNLLLFMMNIMNNESREKLEDMQKQLWDLQSRFR